MIRLFLDFETRSACDLKKHGMHVYSEDPTTDVLCLAVKITGWNDTFIWKNRVTPGKPGVLSPEDPFALLSMIFGASEIYAHNCGFEAAIWRNVCVKRYGWPPLPVEKLRCSASQAAMHALPRSLGNACEALGVEQQKDYEGYRIMMRLCRPRKPKKNEKPGLYWHEDPADFEKLYSYCIQDVVSEESLTCALKDLPERELAVWQLDQIINERGVQVDLSSAKDMLKMVDDHTNILLERLRILTNGMVNTGKQVESLRRFLWARGCELPDLTAATVKAALLEDWDPDVKELLEIRRSLGRSSSAKYQSMIDRASEDGRVRGALLYHGTSTGRFAGSGIQPQNFVSRIKVSDDPETMLSVITVGGLELFKALYDDDPTAASGVITRSVLTAKGGCDLVVGDLSAIEGRVLAWLAGEEAELDVYRSGRDPYISSASMILHKPYDAVTKEERGRIGKTSVLACIAEGSLVLTDAGLVPIEKVSIDMRVWDGEAWVSHGGAVFQGIREVMEYDGLCATPDHVVFTKEGEKFTLRGAAWMCRHINRGDAAVDPALTAGVLPERPVWDLLNCGPRHRFTVSGVLVHNCGYGGSVGAVRKFGGEDMTDEEIKEQIVNPWREAHPQTVKFWYDLERAALAAVENPGSIQSARGIAFSVKEGYLKCRLPSGRLLYYYDPRILPVMTSWGEAKEAVTYMTVDSLTKKWVRVGTYAGKIAENASQAVARDIMVEGMLRVEAAGYPIVLTVHDEIVSEVPGDFGSIEEFKNLMCAVPTWAWGLPLDANVFRSKRYKK